MVKVVTEVKDHKEGINDLEGKGGHLTEVEVMKVDKEGHLEPSIQWLNAHSTTQIHLIRREIEKIS